jgi:hypothetical protein
LYSIDATKTFIRGYLKCAPLLLFAMDKITAFLCMDTYYTKSEKCIKVWNDLIEITNAFLVFSPKVTYAFWKTVFSIPLIFVKVIVNEVNANHHRFCLEIKHYYIFRIYIRCIKDLCLAKTEYYSYHFPYFFFPKYIVLQVSFLSIGQKIFFPKW